MFRITCFFLFLLYILAKEGYSQFPQNYFVSPLQIPLTLAGNFGEIRPNHYHFGLDFKTMGKEGLNVVSSAEGYVSRIRVSLYGYGKSVYITHPNGYTTLYAHLKEFNPALQKYVEALQLKQESFMIEDYPKIGALNVKKGEIIGLSGNTGSSQGPHLHFEIRKTSTEAALNPLLFGLPVKDVSEPIIKNIALYALSDSAHVNSKERMIISVKQPLPKKLKDTVVVNGSFGLGIETFDRESAQGSLNGVYNIKLLLDNVPYFEMKIDSFSFEYSRYVNAVVDREGAAKGLKIQKLFLAENNLLPVYPLSKNKGKIHLTDGLYHTIKIICTDVTGKSTSTSFTVKSENKPYKRPSSSSAKKVKDFSPLKTNIYKTDDLLVDVPSYALYDPIEFEFSKSQASIPGALTPLYSIHNEKTLLQKAIILSFDVKTSWNIDTTKLVMVKISGKNRTSVGGEYIRGRFIAETKTFGNYTVMEDKKSPVIKSLLKDKQKPVSTLKSINYRISDDLSGIKSYKTFVNNKFFISELDASSAMLSLNVKKMNLKPGKNIITVFVVDERGNEASFSETVLY